ncbi:hypothetical protein IMSAGC008_02264 [Muribaculaceae bacterium]|nr:hypothetical protein IMSAGC008_02264 [Muribaculaceae bacterium]
MVHIDGGLYGTLHLEGSEVDYRYGVVVLGRQLAGVGNIEFATGNNHFLRLEAYRHLAGHRERTCIEAHHGAVLVLAAAFTSNEAADIHIVAVECQIAGRGYVDLADAFCRAGIEHFYLVAAVEHDVEASAVNCDVVAGVAEFERHAGILLGVYVAHICGRSIVEVVEGALVGTHIAFVEHVESGVGTAVDACFAYFLSVGSHDTGRFVLGTRHEEAHRAYREH